MIKKICSNRFLYPRKKCTSENNFFAKKYLEVLDRKKNKMEQFVLRLSLSDELLTLYTPLLILRSSLSSPLVSSIQSETSSNLLDLANKSFLKIDKKGKKSERDEERDADRTNLKLKLKKKTRSKLNFDDDLESVSEVFNDTAPNPDLSLLPMARPAKPSSLKLVETIKIVKSNSSISLIGKKKKISVVEKRELEEVKKVKPEFLALIKPLSVQELADLFVVSTTDIIRSLFLKGFIVSLNHIIDVSNIKSLATEFGIKLIDEDIEVVKEILLEETSTTISLGSKPRPPIVTVMGHVDHGKTTLLDKIRKTQVAKKEAGGITQKIGAYEVDLDYKNSKKRLVFLDTPGHEAFSGMRFRGISITDIVVLVVAADDGIKPQTLEAINYIKASKVPTIVAINKIDKEDASPETIKEELARYDIVSEDWGGDVIMLPISAKQGTNIEVLLESIILLSEILNLNADPESPAEGLVIESYLDRTKGPIATLMVQNGTLYIGDYLVFGKSISKIRGMIDSVGNILTEAVPSTPVLVWGLSKSPFIGDQFLTFKNEKDAKLYINSLESNSKILDHYTDRYQVLDLEGKEKINLIVKTDTEGSSEAIASTLSKFCNSKVYVRLLYSNAGEVTETDVEFAVTSKAHLLAFNTTLASGARKSSKLLGVSIKEFDVIYDLFDHVSLLVENLTGPQYDERFIGSGVVKTVFPLSKSFVAGLLITEGRIIKSAFIEVIRNSGVIYRGSLTSLKHLKNEVTEVNGGMECGIFIEEFDSWNSGDLIKAFELVPRKKSAF